MTGESIEAVKRRISAALSDRAIEDAITLCREALALVGLENFEDWYSIRISLALCLLERSPGGTEDIEDARRIYLDILENIPKCDWRKRASVCRNLGYLHEERIQNTRGDNLKKALEYYELALSDELKVDSPADWALIKAAMGFLLSERREGDRNVTEAATSSFEDALAVLEPAEFSEERHEIEMALCNLKPKRDKASES